MSILLHERLFLCALSDDLLSAAALQCRTEIKSGTYQLVLTVTYAVCFLFMRLQMPTLLFGGMTILFCVLYCNSGLCSVYRFAPRDVPDTGVVKCNRLNLHQPVVHFFTHAFFCLSTPFDTGELVIIDDKPAVFTGPSEHHRKIFQSYARTAAFFFLPR